MKLVNRGIEIIFVFSILFLVLHIGHLPEYENGYAAKKILIEEHKSQGEYAAILTEDNIVDLGNHMAAYLTSGEAPGYHEGNWIVISDIERGNSFFIPNDFSEITNISLSDSVCLNVKGRGDTDDCYEEISVPLFFTDKDCDYIEIFSSYSSKRKTIVESRMETGNLPESIWEENFWIGHKEYKLTFEKISLAYTWDTDIYGECADYQLVSRDEKNDIVYKQIFIGFQTEYENVYWFKDISNDGIPDIIFCTNYYKYDIDGNTDLSFLIWNSEKFIYEWKPLTLQYGVTAFTSPVWNQELSSIIFMDYDYGEEQLSGYMYCFEEDKWKLIRQIVAENGESGRIYEIYYEDDERIENEIILSPGEEGPWLDKSNVWCRDNIGNEYLFPTY